MKFCHLLMPLLMLVSLPASSADCFAEAAPIHLPLVVGGQPAVEIVISARAAEPILHAAEDLQRVVERKSGVTLPILRGGDATGGPAIHIGLAPASRPEDLPSAELHSEAWAIRVRDGHLFLTGHRPTPAALAVYAFLREELGARWFAPGDLWEAIPSGTPGELVVAIRPREEAHDLSPRIWSGHAWTPDWERWLLRNGAVESERIRHRRFQNYMYRVFPRSEYGQSHPEYFPLVNGQRWLPPSDSYRYWWPCFSNPEVVRRIVEHARDRFDQSPSLDSFSLGMDDIAYVCECEACQAMDGSPDDLRNRVFSDRYYRFVNAVAAQLKESHPDRFVGVLIYNNVRSLPRTVTKLEENVFGYLTENLFDAWIPGTRERDEALTRAWAERCAHLYRYDYFGLGTFTPRVAPRMMAEQMRVDAEVGIQGMYGEIYTFLPHTAPMIWALAELQRDRSQSIDALLETFYEAMYGPAAGAMARYFDLLEEAWMEDRPGRSREWVHRNLLGQLQAMTSAQGRAALAELEWARSLASDPPVLERIAIHEAALRFSLYAIETLERERAVQDRQVSDRQAAESLLDELQALEALDQERRAFWAQAHEREDLLGQTLRGLGERQRYLQTEGVGTLAASAVTEGLWRLMEAELPADDRQRLTRRAARDGGSLLVRALAAWQQQHTGQTRNQVINPGFDFSTTLASADLTERAADWRSEGLPPGWVVWSRFNAGSWGVDPTGGLGGGAALYLDDLEKGYLIQDRPATPGQRYRLSVRLKVEPADTGATATALLRFRPAPGVTLPREQREQSITVPADRAGWQRVHLLDVVVPEGAAGLRLMIGGDMLREEMPGSARARVLFDQVQLFPMD